MTEEELRDIKERYPNTTKEENDSLTLTEWYKCRINFYEKDIKSIKDILQEFFRNGKVWECSEEDKEWYKSFVRDLKNNLESGYKDCLLDYKHHREVLNAPSCYKF